MTVCGVQLLIMHGMLFVVTLHQRVASRGADADCSRVKCKPSHVLCTAAVFTCFNLMLVRAGCPTAQASGRLCP